MARIPVMELSRMIEAGEEVLVIDVRSERAPLAPIPGAIRIPMAKIAERQKEIPRDKDIVLFCT
jgi:rhodanese-related sulfurtransferase